MTPERSSHDELKLVAKLLLDKETRAMKALAGKRAELDHARRRLMEEIRRVQSGSDAVFTDKKTSIQYLDVLKKRLERLNSEHETLRGDECAQKERLKSALTAEMRLHELGGR